MEFTLGPRLETQVIPSSLVPLTYSMGTWNAGWAAVEGGGRGQRKKENGKEVTLLGLSPPPVE